MNNLLVPVEVFVRDFDSRFYFSKIASKYFNVYLGEQQELLRYIYKLKPGIYFDKSISINKKSIYERLVSLGWKIVSIDEEGLMIHSNAHKYLNHRVNAPNLKLINFFFTWSENEMRMLLHKYPHHKNKFICTGNLRFEFVNTLSKKKRASNNNILISSSLLGNHRLGEEGLKKLFKRLKRLRTEEDVIDYDLKREKIKSGFRKYYNFIEKLVKKETHYTFIIRPHPAENPRCWYELSESYDNVVVQLPDQPIFFNFRNISCLIHPGCTTAFEALAYGLKSFYFEALPDYNISEKVSYRITEDSTIEQLLRKDKFDISNLNEFSELKPSTVILNILNRITISSKGLIKRRGLSLFYFIYKNYLSPKKSADNHKFPDRGVEFIKNHIDRNHREGNRVDITYLNSKILLIHG